MGWINLFKKEMQDLRTHILALTQEYKPEGKRDQQSLEKSLRDFEDFYQWANILPDETDTEAWRWIGGNVVKVYGGSDEWVSQIIMIKFFFWAFSSRVSQTEFTEPPLYIRTSFETIERLLNENLTSKPSPSKETSDQILRPQTILTILWPYLYPMMVDQPLSAFDVSDWPPVHYHPYHTHKRIYNYVFRLSRKQSALIAEVPLRAPERVYVQPYRTAEFFELKLSVQGSLVPEEHGQGVIVRMPWAT